MLKKIKEFAQKSKKFIIFIPMVIIAGSFIFWGCDRNDLPSVLFDTKNIVDIHLEETLDNSREGFKDQWETYYSPENKKEQPSSEGN